MPFKRSGSKQWYIRVGGVRLSSGTDNYEEARKIERERNKIERIKQQREELDTLKRNALGLKRPRGWKEAVERWTQEKAAKRSLSTDHERLKWLNPRLNHITDINQIDREMVDKMMQTREGVSPGSPTPQNATANRFVALIGGVLNAASRDWAWGNISPRLRRYPERKSKEQWLSAEQWLGLAQQLPPHLYCPALFALATGLRKRNVLGLRWEQVDLTSRTVVVDATEAKSGKTILVPLNDTAVAALQAARAMQVRSLTHCFSYEGKPLGDYGLAWYKALRRAGLEGFTWHGFRHTFNTWLAQRGVSVEIRRRLCGWSSREIADRYTHYGVDHLRPYSKLIDDVVREATQFATQTHGLLATQCVSS